MSLSQIESSVSSLEEQIKLTNKSYKDSTDLIWGWVDQLVGFLGWETVR